MSINGEMKSVAVADLLLDAENPRLPEGLGLDQEKQEDLIVFVAEEYDSLRIAKSISEFGYFRTEPPICVEEEGRIVVVEGNRRVAALKILLSPELREHEDLTSKDDWNTLAESELIPEALEALIVPNRQEVAPLVAYRHISGIEAWEPWAQARFVARLVDEQEAEFEHVASLVGESPNAVRRFYRDHAVLKQAAEEFKLDTSRPRLQFGVFTRAMQDGGVRQYVAAPTPASVERGVPPLPAEKKDELARVLGWVFGSQDRQKVIDESRDISDLGKVLASEEPEALRLLVEDNDLPSAFAAAGGIKSRLLKNLRDATNATQRAKEDFPLHAGEPEVQEALAELRASVDSLEEQ